MFDLSLNTWYISPILNIHWQEIWTLRFVLKNYDQKLTLNSSEDKNCKIQFAFTQSSLKEWKKLAYFAYSYIQTRW